MCDGNRMETRGGRLLGESLPWERQPCVLRVAAMASSQTKEGQQESQLCCPWQGTSLQLLQMFHLHSLLGDI